MVSSCDDFCTAHHNSIARYETSHHTKVPSGLSMIRSVGQFEHDDVFQTLFACQFDSTIGSLGIRERECNQSSCDVNHGFVPQRPSLISRRPICRKLFVLNVLRNSPHFRHLINSTTIARYHLPRSTQDLNCLTHGSTELLIVLEMSGP